MQTEGIPNNCRLAPLSVCLPTVVAEFSRLVARLGLMDCAQLLPQRSQAMRAQRPLEMFFPFDPYLLRRSAQVCMPELSVVPLSGAFPCLCHRHALGPSLEADQCTSAIDQVARFCWDTVILLIKRSAPSGQKDKNLRCVGVCSIWILGRRMFTGSRATRKQPRRTLSMTPQMSPVRRASMLTRVRLACSQSHHLTL